MEPLFQTVSERDILEAVSTLHTLVEDKYAHALQFQRWDHLRMVAKGEYNGAVYKLTVHCISPAVSKRPLRIRVMNVMLPLTGHNGQDIQIASTKDLMLAEIYGWLELFEQNPKAPVILGAISMDPDKWAEDLEYLGKVVRPKVPVAFMPVEEEAEAHEPVGMEPLPGLMPL